jgi:hypothetical protein
MRALTLSLLIAAALLLFVSGCGGSDQGPAPRDRDAPPTGSARRQPAGRLTERQLQARLLTPSDLPSNFVKSRDDSDDDADVQADSPGCERILGGHGDDAARRAEAVYENGGPPERGNRVLLLQESVFSDAADNVERDFAAMRRALDGCRRVTIAGAGFRASMTLRRESFADLGDETLAYALRGRFIAAGMTVPTSGRLVGVRVGNAGAVLFTFGLGRRGGRDVQAVTRRAVRRLTSGRPLAG